MRVVMECGECVVTVSQCTKLLVKGVNQHSAGNWHARTHQKLKQTTAKKCVDNAKQIYYVNFVLQYVYKNISDTEAILHSIIYFRCSNANSILFVF